MFPISRTPPAHPIQHIAEKTSGLPENRMPTLEGITNRTESLPYVTDLVRVPVFEREMHAWVERGKADPTEQRSEAKRRVMDYVNTYGGFTSPHAQPSRVIDLAKLGLNDLPPLPPHVEEVDIRENPLAVKMHAVKELLASNKTISSDDGRKTHVWLTKTISSENYQGPKILF